MYQATQGFFKLWFQEPFTFGKRVIYGWNWEKLVDLCTDLSKLQFPVKERWKCSSKVMTLWVWFYQRKLILVSSLKWWLKMTMFSLSESSELQLFEYFCFQYHSLKIEGKLWEFVSIERLVSLSWAWSTSGPVSCWFFTWSLIGGHGFLSWRSIFSLQIMKYKNVGFLFLLSSNLINITLWQWYF